MENPTPIHNTAEVGANGADKHVTCTCRIDIEGNNVEVLIDTGSSVTLARESAVKPEEIRDTRPPRSCLKSATGHEIQVTHEAKLKYNVGGQILTHWTYICPDLIHEALIGYDFITEHNIVIDGGAQTIRCKKAKKLPIQKTQHTMQVITEPNPKAPEQKPRADDQSKPIKSQDSRERLQELQTGNLTPEERHALLTVVQTHDDCFSWDGGLGTCTLIEHRIELTTDKPVRRSGYKASHHARGIIEKEVREMIDKGIIEPSVSPYAAGVVLVPKKNGETRFCIDYRGLNSITKADNYPLPLTKSEIFDTMGGAKIFSCLDCQQGYWQVKMAEEDRQKTAFRCHLGLWQWRVMPFGLRNAPATYQRLMSHVLSGYTGKFCHVFIDDIICFSRTFEEHLEHLHLIFERLEQANIKIKPSKCSFAKTEVKYLGHLLSPGEIRPDPGNITKVRDLTPPTTVTGVREVVGLASYYRSFVKDFSQRASPLTELTKKSVDFHWGDEQQEAFEDLKNALTSEPVLALPDFTKPFILMTDGSATGLGAVLGQDHGDKKERVVAYASKKTGPLERNYSACESECLALVWATRFFRDYLLGRTTLVITDHWALTWLLNVQNANPRIQRWRMALQEYDLKITHKPGKLHRNADFLSRMHEHFEDGTGAEREDLDPHDDLPQPNQLGGETTINTTSKVLQDQEGPEPRKDQNECTNRGRHQDTGGTAQHVAGDSVRTAGAAKHPREEQVGNPELRKAEVNVITGREALKEAQSQDEDCKHLVKCIETKTSEKTWHRDHTFRISPDGVLEEVTCDLTGEEVSKIVLPQTLIRQAVQDAHAGHLKTKKTLDKLRETYFFKHMYAACHRYVQGCTTCQEKDRGLKYQAPMGTMPEPLGAWHTVAVDVLGPLPQTKTGKKYIIVITDYLTKYVLAVATRNQTAETTAAVLMEKFLEYGLPEKLITDNGSNFRSRLMNELCRLLKISRLFTTPYHPQFDGLCERYNRTLAAMLRAFVSENQTDWDKYLPYVMHAYRAAPQESTRESPFFLMYFRPCRAPLDIMLADPERRQPHLKEIQETKAEAVRRLQQAFQVVKHRLVKVREEQKRVHDKKSKPREFKVGDEVYLLDERVPEGNTRKLQRPWKPGYRIIKRTSPLNYLIEHPDRRGRELRVHVQRLKAAIPEMVWPEDKAETATRSTIAKDKLTELDAWLWEEKHRYKPFRSDPDWGEVQQDDPEAPEANGPADERGDQMANAGRDMNPNPFPGNESGEQAEELHPNRTGPRGLHHHHPQQPGTGRREELPRRSERIRARQAAQEVREQQEEAQRLL